MIQAFRRRAFFYGRPARRHPLPSGLLVAFPRLLGRSLQAPLHRPQDLPHMTGVVAYPRDPLDDRSHPGQRPEIGPETVSPGALPQYRVHELQLLIVQFRRPTGPAGTLNPTRLIGPPRLIPSAHALATDVQFPRDLRLRPLTRGKQPRCASPPLLHGRKISPERNRSAHVTILLLDRRSCHSIMRDSVEVEKMWPRQSVYCVTSGTVDWKLPAKTSANSRWV